MSAENFDWDRYGLVGWTVINLVVQVIWYMVLIAFPHDWVLDTSNAWSWILSYWGSCFWAGSQNSITIQLLGVLITAWGCNNIIILLRSNKQRSIIRAAKSSLKPLPMRFDPRYYLIYRRTISVDSNARHPGYRKDKLGILLAYQSLTVWTNGLSIPYLVSSPSFTTLNPRDDIAYLVLYTLALTELLSIILIAEYKIQWLKGQAQARADRDVDNPSDRVYLVHGPWKYSRHPNYFAEIIFFWTIEVLTIIFLSYDLAGGDLVGHILLSLLGATHITAAIYNFSGYLPPNRVVNYATLIDMRYASLNRGDMITGGSFEYNESIGEFPWTKAEDDNTEYRRKTPGMIPFCGSKYPDSLDRVRVGWGLGMWSVIMGSWHCNDEHERGRGCKPSHSNHDNVKDVSAAGLNKKKNSGNNTVLSKD